MESSLHEHFGEVVEDNEMTATPRKSPSHMAAPLDLSFKNYISTKDLAEDLENHQQRNLTRSSNTSKFSCSAVRLNNNALSNLEEFTEALLVAVECLDDVAWLDLSFNELDKIDREVLKFKNLKVLHLHGNCIGQLEELDKLAALPQLRTLTLHGNPMENEKDYRSYVISILPGLKSLDFSVITKQDRTKAQVWSNMKPKKLNRRKMQRK